MLSVSIRFTFPDILAAYSNIDQSECIGRNCIYDVGLLIFESRLIVGRYPVLFFRTTLYL